MKDDRSIINIVIEDDSHEFIANNSQQVILLRYPDPI